MKKLLSVLFILGMIVAVASCGNTAEEDEAAKNDSILKAQALADSLYQDSVMQAEEAAKAAAAKPAKKVEAEEEGTNFKEETKATRIKADQNLQRKAEDKGTQEVQEKAEQIKTRSGAQRK